MKKVHYLLNLIILLALASCQKTPTASFTTSSTTPKTGEIVSFNNTSENAESFNWNFGDGGTSTQENPNHTYANVGNYSVSLEVLSKNGKQKDIATIAISVNQNITILAPVANFSYSPSSPGVGSQILFSDESTNSPTSWQWNFGDGEVSNQKNPSHTFSSFGNFPVVLTSTNSAGSSSITKNIVVNNQSNFLAGTYNVTDIFLGSTYNYTANISASNTINNRIFSDNFATCNGSQIYFDVVGNSLSFPDQTVNCGNPPIAKTYLGDGTLNGTTITINYTESINGGVEYPGTATYVKQ
jgi:PKD repeat protein